MMSYRDRETLASSSRHRRHPGAGGGRKRRELEVGRRGGTCHMSKLDSSGGIENSSAATRGRVSRPVLYSCSLIRLCLGW